MTSYYVVIGVAAFALAAACFGMFLAPQRGAPLPVLLWMAIGGVLIGASFGCWDRIPRVGDIFDLTELQWARAVVFRGIAGAFGSIAAAPIGVGFARWLTGPGAPVARGRAALAGALLIGGPSASLLASTLLLRPAIRGWFEPHTHAEYVARYASAIAWSDRALAIGAIVAIAGALLTVVGLLRPPAQAAL